MKLNVFILLVVFPKLFTSSTCQVVGIVGLSEYRDAGYLLQKDSILVYGERCSVPGEGARVNATKKWMSIPEQNERRVTITLLQEIRTLLDLRVVDYCDATNNLQCNRSSVCGCADTDMWGPRLQSIREGDKCVIERGAICLPLELSPDLWKSRVHWECQNGTECLFKEGLEKCSYTAVQSYLEKDFGKPSLLDPVGYFKNQQNKFENGLCICTSGSMKLGGSWLLGVLMFIALQSILS